METLEVVPLNSSIDTSSGTSRARRRKKRGGIFFIGKVSGWKGLPPPTTILACIGCGYNEQFLHIGQVHVQSGVIDRVS